MQMPDNLSGMAQPPRRETAMPAAAAPDMGGDPNEGAVEASPQEQAQYEAFVANAVLALFGPEQREATKQNLAAGDAMDTIPVMAGAVVARVAQAAAEAGDPIGQDVLMHGSAEILENLVEYAEAAGMLQTTPETMQGLTARTFDEVRLAMADTGVMDPAAAKANLAEIQSPQGDAALAAMIGGAKGKAPPPKRGRGLLGGAR